MRRARLAVRLVFLLVGAGAMVVGIGELSAELRSRGWVEAAGAVTGVEAHRAFRHVAYRFSVGGETYTGVQDLLVRPFFQIPETGARVAVYYNPEDPTESSLSRGVRLDGGFPLVFIALVIFGLVASTREQLRIA